ncbi:XRE family transcriptional regulator [Coprococcus sp. AM27-12LB]|nr:XRE family transcriptional regulator [Coprococcus sp. AM27-12LB]
MNIGERIRHLRKNELKMTQDDFASKIDISRSNIGNIEIGRIAVTERIISSICREFNVNEGWLRTGEGEMFVPLTKNQLITEFAADLVMEDNTFKKRLFEALAKLNESEWEVLEKLADSLIKKD